VLNADVVGVHAADAEVTIEGPAQADIVKKEVHNGVLTIDYLPVIPGEYLVNVKSHGKHIHGSPFSARISGLCCLYVIIIFACPRAKLCRARYCYNNSVRLSVRRFVYHTSVLCPSG